MASVAPVSGNGIASGPASGLLKQPSKRMVRKKSTVSGSASGKPGTNNGDRTVRRLRLSQALTIPASSTVLEACQRMATRRTDAVLLTDENALLCGIATDRDMSLKVVGAGLDPETTLLSSVMTKNPVFVTIDSSAVEALQKMVQGRFRHLPVVEGGEVVALLDITKCLYDAIARMERAAEKGSAIAAAIEGVEREWGNSATAANTSAIQNFRDKMFRPTLASLVTDTNNLATVRPSDSVFTAAERMLALKVSSVIVTVEGSNKASGILTSKDILMRVLSVAKSAPTTLVSEVMTSNPECVPLFTPIVDALHTMHDGKFLHLPVTDKEGGVVACLDVIHLTHGAVATAAGGGAPGSVPTENMMQQFWDSALALDPTDTEDDSHSIRSSDMSDLPHPTSASSSSSSPSSSFSFKFEGGGRTHKITSSIDSLADLRSAISGRLGTEGSQLGCLQYEDEDGDHIMLTIDDDLRAAVTFARAKKLKTLKLHVEGSKSTGVFGGRWGGGAQKSTPKSTTESTKSRQSGGGGGVLSRYGYGYGTTSLLLVTSLTCVAFGLMAFQKRLGGSMGGMEGMKAFVAKGEN